MLFRPSWRWKVRMRDWRNQVRLAPFIFLGGAQRVAARQAGQFVLRRAEIAYPQLDPRLDGLTVTHLSDFHLGPMFTAREHLPPVVALTRALASDVVCVTGDFVDLHPRAIDEALPLLRTIHAPLGVYGCIGNHDIYHGREPITRRLRDWLGDGLLRGDTRLITTPNGARLCVLGLDWAIGRHRSRAWKQLRAEPWPAADFRLALAHHPRWFDLLADHGVELTLSGHTHGGQISLTAAPGHLLGPTMFHFRYARGWYEKNGRWVHVHTGLGQTVPIRINCPPEVVHITLRRGPTQTRAEVTRESRLITGRESLLAAIAAVKK